jgi:hypothetical protein
MTRFIALVALIVPLLAKAQGFAIVVQDDAALRPLPGSSARPLALLAQGETLEVRGERLDYLAVWDYARERGGFVRATQVRRLALTADEAPELLAVLRFLRGVPGAEPLGIAIGAAYIEAAPAERLNGADGVEALEALGAMAERLARKPSRHVEVVARYGVRFLSFEANGRMRLCYDGAAYRKILAMRAREEQRARALLALSEPACAKPDITLAERLDALDATRLPAYMRNRVQIRRAALWSSVAYQRARRGEDARAAAERSLEALAAIDRDELAEIDRQAYADAELRVGAARVALARVIKPGRGIRIAVAPGEEGQTCVSLVDAAGSQLAHRCTYGVVWEASAVANREGTALALAVQPTDGWRELWLFRKRRNRWSLAVVPPAVRAPGVGTAEFAGWSPGRVRVAHAAMIDGRLTRILRRVRL